MDLDRPVVPPPFPEKPRRKPLLADSAKKPLHLLWIGVLPQIFLLLYNLRAFWIASGEFTPKQRINAYWLGAFEIALIVGVALVALGFHARRKFIPWGLNWFLLFAPVGYLWAFSASLEHLLPPSVSAWILPPGQLIYYQFSLTMPLIFYAIVRLACVEIQISPAREAAIVAGAVVGPPLVWYSCAQLARFFPRIQIFDFAFAALLFVISGIILIAGVTRACVAGYNAIQRCGPKGLAVFAFIVGIAGPVGGLALNAHIPFPADFQGWPVYALAVLNGLLLMLPVFEKRWARRSVWAAQCALFPFTLYFLFVFLPFLPLFIPAIIVAGAGFLILTPVVLFFVHGQKLADGYALEVAEGNRRVLLLLAAVALAILPSVFAVRATVDRVVLRRAMDYVYSPDYRQPDRFQGSPAIVKHSLEHLRDFKAGAYLPYLSDFYNWAVFDNLVLPDDKMNEMARAFFGSDLEPARSDRLSLFGVNPSSARRLREARAVQPPQNSQVRLASLTASTTPEADCERTLLSLDLQNDANEQGEFVTKIEIPDGVFISGFWLHIGKERVPGRIFEKKTAMWVYQKIRDEHSNRDPGILVYSAPNQVELRVFPFAAKEQRRVEIELFYPSAMRPEIAIADQKWAKEGSEAAGACLALTTKGTGAVTLPAATVAQLPPAERVPYLHFIVDRSASSKLTGAQIAEAIRKTAAHWNATETAVTLVNYESADLGLQPIGSIRPETLDRALPQRGGFLVERAIKRTLLAYHDRLSQAAQSSPEWNRYPLLVIIGDAPASFSFGSELAAFADFVPDVGGFDVTQNGEQFAGYDFTGRRVDQIPAHPVALLKVGDSLAPCALDTGKPRMIHFEPVRSEPVLAVLKENGLSPIAPAATFRPESSYSRGVQAWQSYLEWIKNPSLGNSGLAEITELSRETGILLAATSYIVVENSAQWKILALKQKQKLGNQSELEFEETPEPSTWLLVIVGAAVFFYLRRRRLVLG